MRYPISLISKNKYLLKLSLYTNRRNIIVKFKVIVNNVTNYINIKNCSIFVKFEKQKSFYESHNKNLDL